MTDPHVLRTAVAVEQARTLPALARLLESVVDAGELRRYPNPELQGFGTLLDALGRIGNDLTAMNDPTFPVMMFAAALTRICAAQQEIILAFAKRVEALEPLTPSESHEDGG